MSLRKGIIVEVDSNSSKMQTVKIEGLYGEVADNVERFQAFGFCSIPLPVDDNGQAAEVVIADLGSSDRRVVVATDDRRKRPRKGRPGDVMMYGCKDTSSAEHVSATQRFVFLDDGSCRLNVGGAKLHISATGVVSIIADTINITGNLNIDGDINTTGKLNNNGHDVGSTHKHPIDTNQGISSAPV
jgi:phage baseplate assembly protein V